MTTETPSRTLDEAIDALFLLGIDLRGLPSSARWSVHDLHWDDPELLERVLDSIANADAHTRIVWEHFLANVSADPSTHLPNYARMISNAALTARLLEAIEPEVFTTGAFFQTNTIAATLEAHLGISTGDARYKKIHAGIIYCAITHPTAIIRAKSNEWYRLADRRSLNLIETKMEAVLSVLPELCKRRDASFEAIEAMLSITPSLAEGTL